MYNDKVSLILEGLHNSRTAVNEQKDSLKELQKMAKTIRKEDEDTVSALLCGEWEAAKNLKVYDEEEKDEVKIPKGDKFTVTEIYDGDVYVKYNGGSYATALGSGFINSLK